MTDAALRYAFRAAVSPCMRGMRKLASYVFAAIFAALLVSGAHAASSSAELFVQENINRSYAILNDTTLTAQERSEKFRGFLVGIMDVKRVARFALGLYARTTTDVEMDKFTNAFSDYISATLQHELAGNPGETVTITGSIVRAPDDVTVTAKLTGSARGNGAPVNIAFRVRKDANGADTLVDLQVEGMSMAGAQQSFFTTWLQPHHGDVPALTRKVRLRAQELMTQNATVFAHAPTGIKVGVLSCNVQDGWGMVLGSSKQVNCNFVPNNGTAERYVGTITRIGVDIGYTEGGVLIWDVMASESNPGPGGLQGVYTGVTAGAAVGAGVAANVLSGGPGRTFNLQPLSIEGNPGLNIAAGIGALELRFQKS